MPNWCYNRVHGSKKACEMLIGDDGKVTFEKLLPTPPAMKALKNYQYEDVKELEALIDYIYKSDESKMKNIHLLPKNSGYSYDDFVKLLLDRYPLTQIDLCKQLKDECGTFYWYDWRNKFWGCKWDADSEGRCYEGDEEEIEFQTPWSPPEGVINTLVDRFPDLEFVWHCDEESCAFSIDFIANGDGTYREEDAPPEWYLPYIPMADDLDSYGMDECKSLKEAKQLLKTQLGEANYDLNIESLPNDKCNITITVYDWDAYGGGEYYTHTWEGLDNDA